MKTAVEDVEQLELVELKLWDELREQDWLGNLTNKLSELRWLLPKFKLHDPAFRRAGTILELGGGDGWRLAPSSAYTQMLG